MKQCLLFCLLFALCSSLSAQKTIYVKHDASGTNDGTSWANAYTSLAPALASAASGDQLWVAAGTYANTISSGPFNVTTGTSLYGGFNGTETMLSQRNPATNITTLSGDLSGDDVAGNFTMNRSDNVRHVVYVTASGDPGSRAVIDGFVIKGGNTLDGSTLPDLDRRGGGILSTAPITIRNCRFTDNFGESGAGAAVVGLGAIASIIDNCNFDANLASQSGAGLFLRDLLSAEVNRCNFTNNTTNRGSAYMLTCAGLTVDSCLFENNNAGTNFTGGLFTYSIAQGTFTNIIIRNNTAARATAWYNDGRTGGDSISVRNCLIESNTAVTFGAGFYNWQGTAALKNVIFRGNNAPSAGGMYNDGREFDSKISIDSCIFENNTTSDYGGSGMYMFKSNYQMTNSILRNNQAPSSAAAIYNGDTTVFLVKNCVFEKNQSNFGGALANYGSGNKATYEDCVFRENIAATSGGVMNNGFTAQVTLKNCLFENNSARFGGAVSSQNANTGVIVEGCTFYGNDASDNAGAINLGAGISLNVTDSDFDLNTATFGGAVATLGAAGSAVFKNTSFKNNSATTSGGAIINGFKANNLIEDCFFEGNTARFGGGIFCQNDSTGININRTQFLGNNADDNGGGVNIGSGIVFSVNDCRFEVNTADRGGAMEISEDSLDLTVASINNCIFQDNIALTQGAALNLSDATVNMTNCLLIKNLNLGTGAGGAISNNATAGKTAPVTLLNCTVADNTAVIGAGIAQWQDPASGSGAAASLTLQNTILANSLFGLDYEIEDGAPTVVSLGGNLSTDLTLAAVLTGANDLTSADPLFVNADFYDFHLEPGSPCRDKGVATGAPTTDLDGNPRDATPDMGAYEFQTVATHAPNAKLLPLQLWPNPATERVALMLENDWSGDAQVRIIGQNGAVARAFTANKPAGRWIQPLDLGSLPAGVYSVQVLLGTQLHEGSLVKQ